MFLLSWSGAAIGALLVAGALVWRHVHRARIHTRIAAALGHLDAQRRRAGVLVATELGLRAHAELLIDHLTREDDPEVLAALADGVLRNSWEPADRPAMLRLRLWAHEHRTSNPSLSNPSATTQIRIGPDAPRDATPRAWPSVQPMASVGSVAVLALPTPAVSEAPAQRSAPPQPAQQEPDRPQPAEGGHEAGRHAADRAASPPSVAAQQAEPDVDGDAVTEILPIVGNPLPTPRRDVAIPAMRPPSEQRGVRRGEHGTAVPPAVAVAAAAPAPRVEQSSTRLVAVDPLREARSEKARRSTGTRHAAVERGAATLSDLTLRSLRPARSARPRHGEHAPVKDTVSTVHTNTPAVPAAPAEQDSRRARHRAESGRTSFVRSAV